MFYSYFMVLALLFFLIFLCCFNGCSGRLRSGWVFNSSLCRIIVGIFSVVGSVIMSERIMSVPNYALI